MNVLPDLEVPAQRSHAVHSTDTSSTVRIRRHHRDHRQLKANLQPRFRAEARAPVRLLSQCGIHDSTVKAAVCAPHPLHEIPHGTTGSHASSTSNRRMLSLTPGARCGLNPSRRRWRGHGEIGRAERCCVRAAAEMPACCIGREGTLGHRRGLIDPCRVAGGGTREAE